MIVQEDTSLRGKWLSVLLRAGDLPCHALRVSRSKEAFLAAARDLMGHATDEVELINLVEDLRRLSRP